MDILLYIIFGAILVLVVILFVVLYLPKIVKSSQEEFLNLAKSKFETEQVKAKGELDKTKQAVDSNIEKLNEHLARYEKIIKDLEADRTKKYGSLEEQLKFAAKTNEDLQKTTDRLTGILGNVKLRGQWGERMAEDILNYAGLQEGLHYQKNTAFETASERPDFVFNLPDNHKLVMDVKFPLSKYLEYVNSENQDDKERYIREFKTDVKNRIKELTRKDYLPTSEETLDYIIMFIPNEQVYHFVNEVFPGIIDETLKKKVILCSPWSLYAVLRIIWQAWQNYHYSVGLRNVINLVTDFKREFDKFKNKMGDIGVNLEKAHKAYDEMVSTRARKLDIRIEKIESFGKGEKLPLPEETEDQQDKQDLI